MTLTRSILMLACAASAQDISFMGSTAGAHCGEGCEACMGHMNWESGDFFDVEWTYKCTHCQDGYRKVHDQDSGNVYCKEKNIDCDLDGCRECTDPGTKRESCTKCRDNNWKPVSRNGRTICKPICSVVNHCTKCTNPGKPKDHSNPETCDRCKRGYTLNERMNKCVKCEDDNCNRCEDKKVCTKCKIGFKLNKKGICKKCKVDNCAQCPRKSGVCTKCKGDRRLSNDGSKCRNKRSLRAASEDVPEFV